MVVVWAFFSQGSLWFLLDCSLMLLAAGTTVLALLGFEPFLLLSASEAAGLCFHFFFIHLCQILSPFLPVWKPVTPTLLSTASSEHWALLPLASSWGGGGLPWNPRADNWKETLLLLYTLVLQLCHQWICCCLISVTLMFSTSKMVPPRFLELKPPWIAAFYKKRAR